MNSAQRGRASAGIREIDPMFWDLVCGGNTGDIVVTGVKYRAPWEPFGPDETWILENLYFIGGRYDPTQPETPENPFVADASTVFISTVDVPRELTAAEQQAISKLTEFIKELSTWLGTKPDSGHVTLPGQTPMTIGELKHLVTYMDFRLVDDGYPLPNNGGLGSAERNNGNPVFTIPISALVGYAAHSTPTSPGGIQYYLLHELAHVTSPGHAYWKEHGNGPNTETMANNLAKIIATEMNVPILAKPGGGEYSSGLPGFTWPPANNGGSGGGGGGRGGEQLN